MRPGSDQKQDHEYVRGGLGGRPPARCAFLAFEPLAAWRQAWVRPQRRRPEFAGVVRALCDEVYLEAAVVRIVCEHLNTHTAAAFYERYPAAAARRLARPSSEGRSESSSSIRRCMSRG